ncbi:TPA: DNA helicase UvrD [Candidatus Uhrbacteria bacterium]|uniref:PHP domain protein n=2 Tax=Candidatus Uhriibacteriota TaxID=1752732 RepID=A0A0G1QA52_9BACT|nr:MAG: PHP domain protein [Candidatus Uhrbacteria bacterium GW2011_GWF2_46_218]KKU41667.1 MAG: PHP domain protein [Candidatus Uhrbacteria bacterium GW2011_GWE2_46_68]HBK33463.1 DNA helicase UvrD [Candidatus Uhrbacteria bacterium]HCB19110.1 DNA helicase UvrD [Candidatus Uhrbacteria bacterium]
MRLIVDWHIHSKYSRACSKDLELPTIAKWCERKGIQIVTTGDWTHPKWFEEISRLLEETGQGIYELRNRSSSTRFMLTQEVSQIYKQGEKTRRVHNLIFSPSLETCKKVNIMLTDHGCNLKSDGRPILGINSEELYKRLKEIDDRILVVPAHAWTPWFSVFGSKSGFDSLEECFGSMTPYIYAIETGLSSDPTMNRRLSALDHVTIISNSDAHSCHKLGREANVFDLSKEEVSYNTFTEILKTGDAKRFLYTIEFHPEEGKYYADGCADCQFSCSPQESKRLKFRCPSCKKLMTLGVGHRVEALADRPDKFPRGIPHKYIVPLEEVLAESFGVSSPTSKKVQEEYNHLTTCVADEFTLLLDTPLEQIAAQTKYPDVVEAIRRMRADEMYIKPGYDGIFGVVKIFGPDEKRTPKQSTLL